MTATTTKPDFAAAAEFAGLTVTECAKACNVNGCVISGRPYCAHPRKGGVHQPEMLKPEVLARFERAKKRLGITQALEKFADTKTDLIAG
jgi:hypothetical protein